LTNALKLFLEKKFKNILVFFLQKKTLFITLNFHRLHLFQIPIFCHNLPRTLLNVLALTHSKVDRLCESRTDQGLLVMFPKIKLDPFKHYFFLHNDCLNNSKRKALIYNYSITCGIIVRFFLKS
jgi:hypothetical protein